MDNTNKQSNNNLWEEKNLTEPEKNSLNEIEKNQNDTMIETEKLFVKKECGDIRVLKKSWNNGIQKLCTKCGIAKELVLFYKSHLTPDGLKAWCKKCSSEYSKIYKQKNKKWIQQYRKDHAEHQKEYNKQYRKEHTIERKQYNTRYREEKSDIIKKNSRQIKYRYSKWRSGAKSRKIPFNLTLEEVLIMPKICYYTGKELTMEPNKLNSISLDRLDSDVGYTKNNVVFCCKHINIMKSTLTYNQFIDACQVIINNHNKKEESK